MAVILQRLTAKSLTFRGSVGRWVEELLMHIFSLSPIDTLGVFVFACKYASGLRCCTTAYKCDAVFISVVYSASWYGDSKVFLWIIFVIVLFSFVFCVICVLRSDGMHTIVLRWISRGAIQYISSFRAPEWTVKVSFCSDNTEQNISYNTDSNWILYICSTVYNGLIFFLGKLRWIRKKDLTFQHTLIKGK